VLVMRLFLAVSVRSATTSARPAMSGTRLSFIFKLRKQCHSNPCQTNYSIHRECSSVLEDGGGASPPKSRVRADGLKGFNLVV